MNMINREARLTKNLYSQGVQGEWEWNRLNKDPYHCLEFETTMRYLKKHLPRKGLILDAGGGPGRYTVELAKRGYHMVLLDLVKGFVVFAKQQLKNLRVQDSVSDAVEGTITDLSRFEENTFDGVLCLGGPLSHVHPEKERRKAISELIRVAKRGAPIFISVFGKWGAVLRGPARWVHRIRKDAHFRRFFMTGDNYMWEGKGFAHFFELNELLRLLGNEVKLIEQVGLEGLATPHQDAINEMAVKEKRAWRNWLRMHEKTCSLPTVADLSLHFMVIARKR